MLVKMLFGKGEAKFSIHISLIKDAFYAMAILESSTVNWISFLKIEYEMRSINQPFL